MEYLTVHLNWSLEDSTAESNVDYGGTTQEVYRGTILATWAGGHTCDILANNVAAFYPCPTSQPELN